MSLFTRLWPPLNLVAGLLALGSIPVMAQAPAHDLFSDTWVATDALGRSQPALAETGPPRADKFVGIFYWTWHAPYAGGPNDNTKLIAAAGDSPAIEWPVNGAPHHWGEPELGYYRMTDPFVIRKHASMLVDAGVDAIFFDVTNTPFTWKNEYEALCREYAAMRAEGNATPSICFLTPFWDPTVVVDQLWKELYQPGLWKELWFQWEGKPLLLANPDFIKDPALREFFTFRKPMPDYWLGPDGVDQWSWLEVHPQHAFKNSAGEVEQVSVGVGQNALPNTPGPAPMSHKAGAMGRSWHQGARDTREGAVNFGLNFEEQWTRAVALDPKFVFVTGWNEWTAGRFTEWSTYTSADAYYPNGLFIDAYTQEYSRDCEPMRGGHTDNYYYQLAAWVRKFKGVREQPKAAGPSLISIDGGFDDWTAVTPEFRDTVGDTLHRDHLGYGNIRLENKTGRNDIIRAKAAYDAESLYFQVETRQPLTPHTDPHWMLLLLDTDQNAATGWLGYDFVVNQEVLDENTTTIKAWRGGAWEKVGEATFAMKGERLEISLPRSLLNLLESTPSFDLHWADNIQSFGDISELGINGDSAPNRRWNYRFGVQ